MMLARRYASQGWPSGTEEKTGHLGREEDQPGVLKTATGTSRGRGEDEFSRAQGGAAKAREVIQNSVAHLLDADTSEMGHEEEEFVDALESLGDPAKTMAALDVLDRLSAPHEKSLPQVRRALERIQRHLNPLLGKVRAAD